jgi:hypothetical protein
MLDLITAAEQAERVISGEWGEDAPEAVNLRAALNAVSLLNNLAQPTTPIEETQRVKEKVFSIFNDPRYREAWSDGEILTYLLSALDPWWKEASARRAARETTAHG